MSALEGVSLEELQAQFKAIQQQETSHKLSERNVVEILMKLISLGELEIIYTLSGKEYLTPKQLEIEIKDELLQHRGRINIIELQPLLNVDLSHIQAKVDHLLKKDKKLMLVDGELIASYYLDGVAEEINEALQEATEIHLGDLAARFNFTGEFIRDLIERRLGRIIQGRLDRDKLYTEAYIERNIARIRGVLSAITRPTPIATIINNYEFPESIFQDTLQSLMKSGRLNGELQGRKDSPTFVPAVFSAARQKWVQSFFDQNGYIVYNTLERLEYNNPKGIMESMYPDGIVLKSCFIHRKILNQVTAMLEETIKDETYLDVSPVLPSVLGNNDILALLEMTPVVQKSQKSKDIVIIDDVYAASKGFLDRCVKLFEQSYKEKLEKGIIKPKEPPKLSKDEEEEEDAPKRGRGKGAASKGRKGKDEEPPKGSSKKGGKGSQTNEEKEYAELLEDFKKWFEDSPEDFLTGIMSHLRSRFADIKEQANRAVFVSSSGEARQKSNNLLDDINTLYGNIQMFQKGVQSLSPDDEILEKHLLRTLCSDLVSRIIMMQAAHHCIKVDKVSTIAEQNAVAAQLPSQISKSLQKLIGTLSGKSSNNFIMELDKVSEEVDLFLKKLDKKQERQLLLTHRQALLDQLTTENNPATILLIVVTLLYLKKHSVVLHIPGRSVGTAITKLKESVPKNVFDQLSEFQGLVVKFLTSSGNVDPELQTQIDKAIEPLKELALGKEEPSESSTPAKRGAKKEQQQ